MDNRATIFKELTLEKERFEKTLSTGTTHLTKEIERLRAENSKVISGDVAFRLYDTYGFPLEFTREIAEEQGFSVDVNRFNERFAEHREKSRTEAAKSGLADDSSESVRYHTATHLLHAALRSVLGTHVVQRGSNINRERMRFDFTHPKAMTKEEVAQVESMVQSFIDRDLPVSRSTMSLNDARNLGAIGLFNDKYGDEVQVYKMGDVSLEFCGGPHVEHTGEIGKFKIEKEQSSSAGVRRIRATIS
jgi:alanyl-tRNA synthetase